MADPINPTDPIEIWVKIDPASLRFGTTSPWDSGTTVWDGGATIWDSQLHLANNWTGLQQN